MDGQSSLGAQLLRDYPGRSDWLRWAFKAPLVLWRLGLGFLIGRYIMVITTRGRKSGLPRHTLAEWHPFRGSKLVPVNYGSRAQWYRNIEADPHVTIQTSDGTRSAIARRITDADELIDAYHVIKTLNPVMVQWYLDSHDLQDSEADILAHKDRIYMLTFDHTDEPTPPPLEADLAWVWVFVLGALWLVFGQNTRPRR